MSYEISAAVKAAVPAYLAMLDTASDEEALSEEVEQRVATLAREHGLTAKESAEAFAIATFYFCQRLGPRGIALWRSGLRKAVRSEPDNREEE